MQHCKFLLKLFILRVFLCLVKSLKDSVEIAVNEVFHDFNKLQNLSDYNLQTLITIVNSKFLGNATKNVLTVRLMFYSLKTFTFNYTVFF